MQYFYENFTNFGLKLSIFAKKSRFEISAESLCKSSILIEIHWKLVKVIFVWFKKKWCTINQSYLSIVMFKAITFRYLNTRHFVKFWYTASNWWYTGIQPQLSLEASNTNTIFFNWNWWKIFSMEICTNSQKWGGPKIGAKIGMQIGGKMQHPIKVLWCDVEMILRFLGGYRSQSTSSRSRALALLGFRYSRGCHFLIFLHCFL